jgi:hypothetical protein
VGPHAAEQHCHPTLRVLDGGRELVLRCCAANRECSARRTPPPAPNQGGGKTSSKRRRGRAETCESPEQIKHGLALWAECGPGSTSGTQSSPALLRSSTVACECPSRVEFLRVSGGSTDSPGVRCLFVCAADRVSRQEQPNPETRHAQIWCGWRNQHDANTLSSCALLRLEAQPNREKQT